jgi:acyl carrier protein
MTSRPTARDLLAAALGVPPEEIDDATSIETHERWDSLAHFRLTAALEEVLGRTLEPPEILEASGFAGIEKILSRANGK